MYAVWQKAIYTLPNWDKFQVEICDIENFEYQIFYKFITLY